MSDAKMDPLEGLEFFKNPGDTALLHIEIEKSLLQESQRLDAILHQCAKIISQNPKICIIHVGPRKRGEKKR
jgi:hypothetical protein